MNPEHYDKVIIGAGIYGLYAAERCSVRGEKVLLLEYDDEAVARATYVNQARVHNGYHYPRSFSTAKKSAQYFERFCADFDFAINRSFDKVYATASAYSWTNAEQFENFCRATHVPCEALPVERYFRPGTCDGSYLTREFTFDAQIIKQHYIDKLATYPNCHIHYGARIQSARIHEKNWQLEEASLGQLSAPFVLNATYASSNQVARLFGSPGFEIKYEIAEIILVEVSDELKDVGLTVMDGPFFSVMPFGKTGLHSLTSVTFTPHLTSYDKLPTFPCQKGCSTCTPQQLGNCNTCPNRPATAYPFMDAMARKYLREELRTKYVQSLFAIKPILVASEIDHSLPTVLRLDSEATFFAAFLSGKINTIYDLADIL